jgi:hypothetical protein
MLYLNSIKNSNKGFLIIESVIGITITSVLLMAFTSLAVKSEIISRFNIGEFKASMYLRELVEVSKDVERTDWTAFNDPSCVFPNVCHPEISGGVWVFVSGEEVLDNGVYTRSFSVKPVYRDQLTFPNVIVESGGVLDPDTKKIVANLVWDNGVSSKAINLESYVYNP